MQLHRAATRAFGYTVHDGSIHADRRRRSDYVSTLHFAGRLPFQYSQPCDMWCYLIRLPVNNRIPQNDYRFCLKTVIKPLVKTYQKEQMNVYEVQAMLSMMDANCVEGSIQDWPQTCGLLDQNWQKKRKSRYISVLLHNLLSKWLINFCYLGSIIMIISSCDNEIIGKYACTLLINNKLNQCIDAMIHSLSIYLQDAFLEVWTLSFCHISCARVIQISTIC